MEGYLRSPGRNRQTANVSLRVRVSDAANLRVCQSPRRPVETASISQYNSLAPLCVLCPLVVSVRRKRDTTDTEWHRENHFFQQDAACVYSLKILREVLEERVKSGGRPIVRMLLEIAISEGASIMIRAIPGITSA